MSATRLIHALRNLADELYAIRDHFAEKKDARSEKAIDHAAFGLQTLAHIVEGKTVEKAFGAPGNWGYNSEIGKGLFHLLRSPREEDPSFIQWRPVSDLPDDEVRVMFAAGDDVEVGHHEGDHWVTTEGHLYADSDVYAWAHLPAAANIAVKKGGAS